MTAQPGDETAQMYRSFRWQAAGNDQRVYRLAGKDAQRFGEERQGFKFVAADRKRQDGEIDRAGAEAFEQDGSDLFDDGDGGFGEAF